MKNFTHLHSHHIVELTDKAELVNLMGEVFRRRAYRADESPARFAMGAVPVGIMPELSARNPGVIQTKFVALSAGAGHGGHVLRLNAHDGELVAIFSGKLFTSYRTAASSLAVAKLLRPQASSILLMGTGEQALRHFEFFRAFYPDALIHVMGRSEESLLRFQNESGRRDFVLTRDYPPRTADIICTLSGATEPILGRESLSDRTLVIAVGSCQPTKRELSAELLAASQLFVDSLPQARREAGDFLTAEAENIRVLDRVDEVGRLFRAELVAPTGASVFKSLGLAEQDLAFGDYLMEKYHACR